MHLLYNLMPNNLNLLCLQLISLTCLIAGVPYNPADAVEWFGEPRGGLDSFYDLVYDDQICPGELRSEAIQNHIFLGSLLQSLFVASSTDCIQECYMEPKCKSANYFQPGIYHKSEGYCELMNMSQWDDMGRTMWWLKPYKSAVHYEHIHCYDPEYYDPQMTIKKHMNKMHDAEAAKTLSNLNEIHQLPTNKAHKKMDPFAQNLFKKLGDYMKTFKH